ncbi:Hin recombinase [Klebsiella aerogenes]|nr:Hin recombinase [Klebsiella aerogenes]
MNSVNSDYLLSTLLTLKHWSWTTFQYFCNYRGEAVGGGGYWLVMTSDAVEHGRRMLANGATRQQVADVIGVGVKTIYKYFPVSSVGNFENQ